MLGSIDTGTFGQMSLLQPIGRGGMATVYLAELRGSNGFMRRIAVKLIEISRTGLQSEQETWFSNEARLGGLLQHDNIAQTLFFGREAGMLYLAMEYVDGPSLHDVQAFLKREQTVMPVEIALQIFDQLCEGMDAAHRATDSDGRPLKLVHRDLKPSNLMFTGGGTLKVCDFGVARAESNAEQTLFSGLIKGTVRYMSPEQAYGKRDLDARSDLFSMAALLYELISGTHLYVADGIGLQLRIAQDAVVQPRIDALREDLPERAAFQAFFQRALAKDREDRFQSAREMQQAIDVIFERLPRTLPLKKWLAPYVLQKSAQKKPKSDKASQEPGLGLEAPSGGTLNSDTRRSGGGVEPGDPNASSMLAMIPWDDSSEYAQAQSNLEHLQLDAAESQISIHTAEHTAPPSTPSDPMVPPPMPRADAGGEAHQRLTRSDDKVHTPETPPTTSPLAIQDNAVPAPAPRPQRWLVVGVIGLLLGAAGFRAVWENSAASPAEEAQVSVEARPQAPAVQDSAPPVTSEAAPDPVPGVVQKQPASPPSTKNSAAGGETTAKAPRDSGRSARVSSSSALAPSSPNAEPKAATSRTRAEGSKTSASSAAASVSGSSTAAQVPSLGSPQARTAVLTLNTTADAVAFVDERRIEGPFPVRDIPITPGEHTVRFVGGGGDSTASGRIRVDADQRMTCVAKFGNATPELLCRRGTR